MTCIVGVQRNGEVWIGGDSAGCAGWDKTLRKDPKVFRVGQMVIGFTTSFRMGQLLRYHFAPPPVDEGQDPYEYLVRQCIPLMRACLREGGALKVENGVDVGGQFLIGFRRRLFAVDSDFQVIESRDPFYAIGCGANYALGALHASYSEERGAIDELVRIGLEAAAHFSAGVAPPFTLEATP